MDWQPIKTAPKNKRILLFKPKSRFFPKPLIVVGEYYDARHYTSPNQSYWEHDLIRVFGRVEARQNPPTHWQPLPEPPEGK